MQVFNLLPLSRAIANDQPRSKIVKPLEEIYRVIVKSLLDQICYKPDHGRWLRWDWGNGPPKFEIGDGPCIRPPAIFEEVVHCYWKRGKVRTD